MSDEINSFFNGLKDLHNIADNLENISDKLDKVFPDLSEITYYMSKDIKMTSKTLQDIFITQVKKG